MSDMMSRKAVYDALECMRFASDAERRYGFSLLEQIPTVEPDQFADVSKKDDLISREDALNCFHDWIDQRGDVHTADEMPEYQRIEQLPSAQPEIIRCKDCKWYELPSHKITENCVRWMKSNGILLPIKPNDYCSRAERRTDETN